MCTVFADSPIMDPRWYVAIIATNGSTAFVLDIMTIVKTGIVQSAVAQQVN